MLELQTINQSGANALGAGLAADVSEPTRRDAAVRESSASGDEPDEKTQDQRAKPDTPEAHLDSLQNSSPRARLGYSFTESETYVELLNPRTGEVIQRFPPERAESELRDFADGDAGVLLNQIA